MMNTNIKEVERLEKYNGLIEKFIVTYKSGSKKTYTSKWSLPETVKNFIECAEFIQHNRDGEIYSMCE